MRFSHLLLLVLLITPFSVKGASYPPAPSYGALGTTNQLIQPSTFTLSSSDWAPIVVSNSGTPGADGSYYQSLTNLTAGLPYAVWTNSNGSVYRIVENNTNIVPSSIASNLWTIENTINVNTVYEMLGLVPFGTWSLGDLAGTPGVVPTPTVGTHFPSLITVSSSISGGTLTMSPGLYDLGYYAWFPTNLTVVAFGTKIIGFNAVDMVHPFGKFVMYGGSISNANVIGGNIGGTAFQITHITNALTLHDVEIFGPSDGLFGNFNSDNLTLDILGGLYGGWWDTIVIGKAAGLTNVTGSIIGARFWNRTNFISASSSFINATLNRVLISGCTMNMGIGFTGGAGVNVNDANTTNEINGCAINMQPGCSKILQTAGKVIVNGSPYDPVDYSGTVTFTGTPWYSKTNSMTAQTVTVGASVYTNMGNNLTFSGLTATPTGNYEGTGTATLLSNGADRTVVTPVSWHCSDYVSTRTLTNGNQMVVSVKVIPGISTNVAVAQFK